MRVYVTSKKVEGKDAEVAVLSESRPQAARKMGVGNYHLKRRGEDYGVAEFFGQYGSTVLDIDEPVWKPVDETEWRRL